MTHEAGALSALAHVFLYVQIIVGLGVGIWGWSGYAKASKRIDAGDFGAIDYDLLGAITCGVLGPIIALIGVLLMIINP